MAEDNIKRKMLYLNERHMEMLNDIKAEKGYKQDTMVFYQALIDMHAKMFPAYARTRELESPTEKVNRKEEEKKAKEDIVKSELLAIAQQLGGEIIDKGGKEFVKYFNYSGKKRFEQLVPLTMMSTDLVKIQYQPSRERVEQLQKEGKTEY